MRVLQESRLTIYAFAFGFLSLFTSCSREPESDVPRHALRIGYIQVLSGLPMYAAQDAALFSEAGFTVELHPYATSDLLFKAIESSEIDMVGVGGLSQALMIASANPRKLTLLGLLYSSSCLMRSTKADAPMSIAELSGKRIGCFPGSVFETYTREVMRAAGLVDGSYSIVPLKPPLQIQALKEGSVDALFTLEPTGATSVLEGVGAYLSKEDLLAKYILQTEHFPGGCVVVTTNYLKSTPESGRKLVQAFRVASRSIGAKDFDASRLLLKYTTMPVGHARSLEFEGATFGKDMDLSEVQRLVAALHKWSLIPADFDLATALEINRD